MIGVFELKKTFDAKRMKRLVAKDSYLKMMLKDIKKRNPKESEASVLRILFNSNVANDSDFDHIY